MVTFTEESIDLRLWDAYAGRITRFYSRTTTSSLLAVIVTRIHLIWSLKKLLIIWLELITAFRWLDFRLQALTGVLSSESRSSPGGRVLPQHPMQSRQSLFWAMIPLLPDSSTSFFCLLAFLELPLPGWFSILLPSSFGRLGFSTLVCEGASAGFKSNACSVHQMGGTASSPFQPNYWFHLPREGVKAARRNTAVPYEASLMNLKERSKDPGLLGGSVG